MMEETKSIASIQRILPQILSKRDILKHYIHETIINRLSDKENSQAEVILQNLRSQEQLSSIYDTKQPISDATRRTNVLRVVVFSGELCSIGNAFVIQEDITFEDLREQVCLFWKLDPQEFVLSKSEAQNEADWTSKFEQCAMHKFVVRELERLSRDSSKGFGQNGHGTWEYDGITIDLPPLYLNKKKSHCRNNLFPKDEPRHRIEIDDISDIFQSFDTMGRNRLPWETIYLIIQEYFKVSFFKLDTIKYHFDLEVMACVQMDNAQKTIDLEACIRLCEKLSNTVVDADAESIITGRSNRSTSVGSIHSSASLQSLTILQPAEVFKFICTVSKSKNKISFAVFKSELVKIADDADENQIKHAWEHAVGGPLSTAIGINQFSLAWEILAHESIGADTINEYFQRAITRRNKMNKRVEVEVNVPDRIIPLFWDMVASIAVLLLILIPTLISGVQKQHVLWARQAITQSLVDHPIGLFNTDLYNLRLGYDSINSVALYETWVNTRFASWMFAEEEFTQNGNRIVSKYFEVVPSEVLFMQYRVQLESDSCVGDGNIPPDSKSIVQGCAPIYTLDNYDTEDIPGSTNIPTEIDDAFMFQEEIMSKDGSTFKLPSGTVLSNSGYAITIPVGQGTSASSFQTLTSMLFHNNWIDPQTRAVVLRTTLYHHYYATLFELKFTLELSAGGRKSSYFALNHIQSEELDIGFYCAIAACFILALNVVCLGCALGRRKKTKHLWGHARMLKYLCTTMDIIGNLVLLGLVISLIVLITQFNNNEIRTNLSEGAPESLESLNGTQTLLWNLRIVVGLLLFFLSLKMVFVLRIMNRNYSIHFKVFHDCGVSLLAHFLSYFVMLVTFASVSIVWFGATSEPFHNFKLASLTLIRLSFGDMNALASFSFEQYGALLTCIFFGLFLVACALFLQISILSMFVDSYFELVAKRQRQREKGIPKAFPWSNKQYFEKVLFCQRLKSKPKLYSIKDLKGKPIVVDEHENPLNDHEGHATFVEEG